MSAEDDTSVPNDLKLYRRIRPDLHMVPDENLDCTRVSSGAFRQREMSVILDDTLRSSNREPRDVVTQQEPYLVFLTAEQARAAGQVVCRAPIEEDFAHGEVIGSKGSGSRRKQLLRAILWAVAPEPPECGCEPPCGSLSRNA